MVGYDQPADGSRREGISLAAVFGNAALQVQLAAQLLETVPMLLKAQGIIGEESLVDAHEHLNILRQMVAQLESREEFYREQKRHG